MLINGNGLMKKVVLLLEKENKFLKAMYEISEKGATAENLQDRNELVRLGSEGAKLSREVTTHMLEKSVVMSMVIVNNPNFRDN